MAMTKTFNVDKDYGTIKKYAKAKVDMLQGEFFIKLTDAQIEHMNSLENEIQIDNYAHKIIMDCL